MIIGQGFLFILSGVAALVMTYKGWKKGEIQLGAGSKPTREGNPGMFNLGIGIYSLLGLGLFVYGFLILFKVVPLPFTLPV